MKLESKTLEKLRNLINEETEYKTGQKLVSFFNSLGGNDQYAQGFPSRWMYTDEKLANINGTATLDQCIKKIFSPVNFIGNLDKLDNHLIDFNKYLMFDGWKLVRKEKDIMFEKANEGEFETVASKVPTIDEFLNKEFSEIPIDRLGLDGPITNIIQIRLDEIKKCLESGAYLAAIFLCGSTLEGVLLGIAAKHAKAFNQTIAAPKDKKGKVKAFPDWTLSNFIDVAHELKLLHEDVKKYSHTLRDFRNYIHPYQQLSSQFNPTKHTAKISWQVLKVAFHQLVEQSISELS